MNGFWQLNWNIHTKYEEIQPNIDSTTYFLYIRAKEIILEKIKKWFEKKEFKIEPKYLELDEPFSYVVKTKEQAKIITFADYNECIIINCLNEEGKKKTNELMNSLKSTIVECQHKEEFFNIPDTELTAISRTGFAHEGEDFSLPKTFYKFYKGKETVAIMLLEYMNYEMSDCTPTIMMIEVAEQFRGLGYGKKILKTVECRLKQSGFRRIWASETNSEWFWKKMGYHFDIDEAYRDLTRIKC